MGCNGSTPRVRFSCVVVHPFAQVKGNITVADPNASNVNDTKWHMMDQHAPRFALLNGTSCPQYKIHASKYHLPRPRAVKKKNEMDLKTPREGGIQCACVQGTFILQQVRQSLPLIELGSHSLQEHGAEEQGMKNVVPSPTKQTKQKHGEF